MYLIGRFHTNHTTKKGIKSLLNFLLTKDLKSYLFSANKHPERAIKTGI